MKDDKCLTLYSYFCRMISSDKRLFKFPKFEDLIIHEDSNMLVINKPPYVASLDTRGGGEVNILRLAKQYHRDAQVRHRLAKDTSGVLLIAQNAEAYRAISMALQHRELDKVYHAIIARTHAFEHLLVELPIINQGTKNVLIDRYRGKPSETAYNSLRYYKPYTSVECKPTTGRMHQI